MYLRWGLIVFRLKISESQFLHICAYNLFNKKISRSKLLKYLSIYNLSYLLTCAGVGCAAAEDEVPDGEGEGDESTHEHHRS